MNTYEVTDPDAPEGYHWREGRPHETVQDWIANGADDTEIELRYLMELIDDDDWRHAHENGLCGVCNDAVTVADREHWEEIELAFYGVKWDPSIRL